MINIVTRETRDLLRSYNILVVSHDFFPVPLKPVSKPGHVNSGATGITLRLTTRPTKLTWAA